MTSRSERRARRGSFSYPLVCVFLLCLTGQGAMADVKAGTAQTVPDVDAPIAQPTTKADGAKDGEAARRPVPRIVGRDDFAAMVDIAKGYGDAELTKTGNGDPVIVGNIDGTAYQMFFLDCKEGRNCDTLDFYAIWNTTGIQLDDINGWNQEKPFHKAYLSEDGFPVVELNLSLAGGITTERFEDALDRWTIELAEFQSEVLDAQK